jgi:foldase protein PrsA
VKRSVIFTLALVAALLLAVAALSGCGSSDGGSADLPADTVATVGGVSITRAQVDELIRQASAQLKGEGDSFPAEGTARYDEYMAKMVEYLVGNEVIIQSAADNNVSVSDTQVNGQIQEMVSAYGGQKKFDSTLKASGMTQDLLKRTIKSQLLAQAVQSAVSKGASVKPADIKSYWDAHKDQLGKDKKTDTFAKAKPTIRSMLLSATQQKLWNEWLDKRMKELGVTYAEGFDPKTLRAEAASLSPSPTASAAP